MIILSAALQNGSWQALCLTELFVSPNALIMLAAIFLGWVIVRKGKQEPRLCVVQTFCSTLQQVSRFAVLFPALPTTVDGL